MTTLSPNRRIIKRPNTIENTAIEQYVPPRESLVKGREPIVERKLSFPRYGKDGREAGEYHMAYGLKPLDVEEKPKKEKPQPEEEIKVISEEEQPDPDRELLKKWKEEAAKVLEDAKAEANRILEEAADQARQEKDLAHEAGMREGYEAGYREGREKAESECRQDFQNILSDFREDMTQALKSVERAKESCLRAYLDELKDCAVAVGEKVIHISLRSSGEVIKQMIIAATEKLKKTAWVKIYIDKCDYDMMIQADADILDELSHLSDNIKFIVMDKEDRGNCIIEMPEEIIDVSVNTQMENIKDILENVRV
jgi:flagellar assembly protein FliH